MPSNQAPLRTARLVLGPWAPADLSAGLAIFGNDEVTHWLIPAEEPVHDEAGMLAALERWAQEDADGEPPVGHWAVRRGEDDVLLGSITLRRMPPFQEDLELAWQFDPAGELALGAAFDLHRQDHELGQRHGAPPEG